MERLPLKIELETKKVLFKHPYTKIDFLQNDLDVSRQTAYLNKLDEDDYVAIKKVKLGNENYYINVALFELFDRQS